MVWALPEVRAAASGDGKIMSDATEILYQPDGKPDCYFVRMAKDYGWRLGRNLNVPFFYIYPKKNKLLVNEVVNDSTVTVAEWRRLRKAGAERW